MPNTLPAGVDPKAYSLWLAIRHQETGGDYTAKGASGEYGAGQWEPGNFENGAKQYLGSDVSVEDATPAQQNYVGYNQVKAQLDAGKNPAQVASWWNSGSYDWQGNVGTNKEGVHFDTPAYVQSVGNLYTAYYRQNTGNAPGQAGAGGALPPVPTSTDNPAPPAPTDGSAPVAPAQTPTPPPQDPTKGVVQSVVDDLANPFLRIASNYRFAAARFLGGNTQAQQKQLASDLQASGGYDYGYLGKATPTGVDPNKTGLQNLADDVGVGLNLASFAIPVGAEAKVGEEAVAVAVDAAKAGGAVKTALKAGAKTLVSKPTLGFAAAQGGSAGAEAIAQGKGAGQSALDASGAFVASAATLGLMNVAGKALGSFGQTLLKSKAGEAISTRISEVLNGLKTAVTPEVQTQNALSVKLGVEAGASRLGKTIDSMLKYVVNPKTGMLAPYPDAKKGLSSLISGLYDNVRPMRGAIQKDFHDVFSSGFSIGKEDASELLGVFGDMKQQFSGGAVKSAEDLTTQVNQAKASGATTQEIADIYHNYAQESGGASIASNVENYLGTMQKEVIQPLLAGNKVDVSVLDRFIHFIQPKGNSTEQAIGKKLQDTLYGTFEDAMKSRAPGVLDKWLTAKESFRQLNVSLDKRFRSVFEDVSSPQELADKFVTGNLLPTPADTKEFLGMIGNGIGDLQKMITRRVFETAQKAYETTVGKYPTPETLEKAGNASKKVFDDFIEKATKASDETAQLMTPEQLEFLHDASNMTKTNLWDLSKNASSMLGEGADDLKTMYDNVTRGADLAKQDPSMMAEKLSKMSVEDIQAVKGFYSPEQWQGVGLNVLKNIATKVSSVFSSGFDQAGAEKFLTSLGDIGGANKEQVFESLFGDTPEIHTAVQGLFKAVEAMKGAGEESGSAGKAAMHGIASFVFAVAHHPILSISEGRKAFGELASKSESQIFDEMQAQLEKSGKISVTGWRKGLRALAPFLKNYFAQQGAGRAAASGGSAVGDVLSGQQ